MLARGQVPLISREDSESSRTAVTPLPSTEISLHGGKGTSERERREKGEGGEWRLNSPSLAPSLPRSFAPSLLRSLVAPSLPPHLPTHLPPSLPPSLEDQSLIEVINANKVSQARCCGGSESPPGTAVVVAQWQ